MLIHPDFPLAPTIEDVPDLYLKEESVRPPISPEEPIIFCRASVPDFHDFESAITGDHTVNDWALAMDFGESRIYRIHLSSETEFITPKFAELGIYVIFIKSATRGWRFKVEAPKKESLSALWEYCREEDFEFHLEKIHNSTVQASDPEGDSLKALLTDRQLDVVRTATQMGYYDQDGATAEEVATELGISPSTLSTHLRRIMAKIFHHMF